MVGAGAGAGLGDLGGVRLGVLAGRGVDQRRAGAVGGEAAQALQLLGRAADALDGELEVRPIEAAHEDGRVAKPELPLDVAPHLRRRRRGEGDDARRPPARDHLAEPHVIGTKIVPPLADAVRLVDGEEREPVGDLIERVEETRAPEPLGRDVREAQAPGGHVVETRAELGGRERRGERAGRHAPLREGVDLILHERDERRDDERGPARDDGGELVAQRFSGAGRHDRDGRPPRQHRVDDLALPRSKRLQAEDGAESLRGGIHDAASLAGGSDARSRSGNALTQVAAPRKKVPHFAQVAQLVEQRTENPRVAGSIPALGTRFPV